MKLPGKITLFFILLNCSAAFASSKTKPLATVPEDSIVTRVATVSLAHLPMPTPAQSFAIRKYIIGTHGTCNYNFIQARLTLEELQKYYETYANDLKPKETWLLRISKDMTAAKTVVKELDSETPKYFFLWQDIQKLYTNEIQQKAIAQFTASATATTSSLAANTTTQAYLKQKFESQPNTSTASSSATAAAPATETTTQLAAIHLRLTQADISLIYANHYKAFQNIAQDKLLLNPNLAKVKFKIGNSRYFAHWTSFLAVHAQGGDQQLVVFHGE